MPFEIGGKGDAFHVTYKYALTNGIRYLYSGYPLRYTGREEPDYPNFDMLRLARENSGLRRTILQLGTTEHRKNDVFLVPRAPAFKGYGQQTVNRIVSRLHTKSPDVRCLSRQNSELSRASTPCVRPISTTSQRVTDITERLYRTHTKMSARKRRDRAEVLETLPILKNTPDPDRIRRPRNPMHTHPVIDV